MASIIDQYPQVRPGSRSAWRSWLSRHHRLSPGVWVVYSKRSAGRQPLSYNEAVEEALCYGWIDSLVRAIDEGSYRQLFTPRKPRSVWSALNKRRVAALIKARRMTEAGMAKVRSAQRDGTWSALNRIDRLELPAELTRALRANARARANFEAWSMSTKRAVLWWLHSAKRPETRAFRLKEIVTSCARGTKPRPMRVAP